MAGPGSTGFFGKLPGVGDFVQRRLPTAFVSAWDAGFEAAVSAARTALGEAWHGVWQNAPVWRFALMPGVCGVQAWVGVTGPSVDRVGRGFPMVLACPLTDADAFGRIVRTGAGWFGALERVCRGADATSTADAFDAAVAALPAPVEWLAGGGATSPESGDWTQAAVLRTGWIPSGEDPLLKVWLTTCMDTDDGCLWWTTGGARVPSSALLTHGLPRPQDYAAFLDASLAPADWHTQGRVDAPGAIPRPQATAARLPDDLDDVLSDLLPDTAGIDAGAGTAAAPAAAQASTIDDLLAPPPRATPPDAADAAPRDTLVPGDAESTRGLMDAPDRDDSITQPAPATGTSTNAGVLFRQAGALTVLAADNGPPDPRRQAAARVGEALADAAPQDAPQWRERLLALHAPLRERGEDLVNPVPEDGAAVVLRLDAGQATLLRVGAAGAWHWRRGQLRPLFEDAGPEVPSDEADTVRPGDLTGVLSERRAMPTPGLGCAGGPRCDEIRCLTAPGDRLVLLATDTLMRVPAPSLATCLAADTGEEACARIAAAAGLGTDRPQWPVAVIEVGT